MFPKSISIGCHSTVAGLGTIFLHPPPTILCHAVIFPSGAFVGEWVCVGVGTICRGDRPGGSGGRTWFIRADSTSYYPEKLPVRLRSTPAIKSRFGTGEFARS